MLNNILDALPTPNATPVPSANTTPVPSANAEINPSVNTPSASNTSGEGWLNNLLNAVEPDKPEEQQVTTPVTKSPESSVNPIDTNVLFDKPAGLPDLTQVDGVTTPENSELGELKKLLNDMQQKQAAQEEKSKFDTLLNEQLKSLKSKYGESDPKIVEEFGDIFKAFRAELGAELGQETLTSKLELQQQLLALQAKVDELTTSAKTPSVSPVDVYRNTIVTAIPNYNQIVSSDYFKQLLNTPVDAHNPNFTYNHKIGNMFQGQKTQDILNFFNEVSKKLSIATPPSTVVDPGVQTLGSAMNENITPQKIQQILTKVMNGELKIEPDQLTKLRQMAGKMIANQAS